MPRPQLDRVVEVVEAAQRRVQRVRPGAGIDGQVGAADLADEQGIAAQQRERLAGAVAVARARARDARDDGPASRAP